MSLPAVPLFRSPVLALALCLTLAPRPARADLWYEHYAAAEKALAVQDWARAVEELNSALEKKGDSGVRARTYGMKFTAYYPYLKLGIAYYELGQIDAALQAFETEERLGAIAESDVDRADLDRYRELARRAKSAAEKDEAARIQAIVTENLALANRLEEEGDVEGSIAALGRALAVSPEEATALDRLDGLRAKLAEERAAQERRQRIGRLVERGRDLAAADRLAEASSVLRQALELEEDPVVRQLLDRTQERLRDELEAGERRRATTQGLADAVALEAEGRFAAALDRLQPVLALDPENREARALEESLLRKQTLADRTRRRGEALEDELLAAETALQAEGFEEALAAANRALALEAGNPRALDQLARAYRGVSRRLLGDGPRQNFPPAIRFADQRSERPDGTFSELVRRSDFVLTGVVIDDSVVDVEFYFSDSSDAAELEAATTTQALGDLYITEFRLAHRLRPGLSSLLLTATDAGEMTSIAEYAVLYSPPWWRSPWLHAALAALVVALVGAARMVGQRRKRRLRRRRFNPYMAGAPVLDEDLFFGREQLMERILQTLHNNSLLLHGERRIGKTTLQHQLKKRLESLDDPVYEFFAVYIDLQGTREERFFATLGEEIFAELEPVLGGLQPVAPFSRDYSYRHLLADLRAVLRTLRQRSDKQVRLVLLIDEVDELNAYDPRVNQKLRSLFMKSFAENLVAVVSGVSIKREWEREGSPWYNFFEEIDVGPFHPEHARELVEKPIRGLFQLQDGVVERIVELTGGRPYRIQRLCMKLVSRAYETGRRSIAVADVDTIGDPDSRGAA